MSQLPPFDPSTPLGGRYRLRQPLGEGSFAVTYLAEDLVLGRMVAVKVLRARHGGDAATAARFEREARAAAAVSSPYIVDVFDYGTDRGAPYIVLQYVPGSTLRDLIRQAGRLSPRDAVGIAIDVLRGLAVIHDAGIVHRDVKPENVLIDRNGTSRVTDFGVALWAGNETLTAQGMAVGTAVYMAPEQALGTEVTPAADLYAVGVMLFEMLTGQPPFRGDSFAMLLMSHVRQEPPLPSAFVPGLASSVALEREVMRALAKDPGDRRPNARAMAQALESALHNDGAYAGGVLRSPGTATTAAVPALAGRSQQAATGGTAVASGIRPASTARSRAWLAPLLLLMAAVTALALFAANGGFQGLAGITDPGGERDIAILATTPGATPAPTGATGNEAAERDVVETATPSQTPADRVGEERILFPVQTQEPTAPPAETPTEIATAIPTPLPTEEPTSIPTPPPTEQQDPIVVETSEPGFDDASTGDDGSGAAIQFGPGDWQGAGAPDPDLGRQAVALYGAEGDAARGVLQFTLPAAPGGRMVLTLFGLGDETGLSFPFGIEVNGMYVGQSPSTFDNWHPARDGLHGEQAAWDQVRINLPPEVFHAGLNEIAIVSLAPGDYDDRVPYLLLSDAILTPE